MTGECTPFFISDHDSTSGGRLGGFPPQCVGLSWSSRYLLTVPAFGVPHVEISVFVDDDLLPPGNVGVLRRNRGVYAVAHPTSPRDPMRPPGFSPGYALHFEEPRLDLGENGEPYPTHKLGGRPFYLEPTDALVHAIQQITQASYVQVLQLDLPANRNDARVQFSWPFGDGIFHLFGKSPLFDAEWYWFWEIQ